MNDFTKEELINLLSCVKSNKAYHINHMEIIYPVLMNKIQSMIDNYDTQESCQHESDGSFYDCGWIGANDGDTKCKKCVEFYK